MLSSFLTGLWIILGNGFGMRGNIFTKAISTKWPAEELSPPLQDTAVRVTVFFYFGIIKIFIDKEIFLKIPGRFIILS